jgi:hypothetical protein
MTRSLTGKVAGHFRRDLLPTNHFEETALRCAAPMGPDREGALCRLPSSEILAAVDVGAFPPRVGWHCQDCPVRSRLSFAKTPSGGHKWLIDQL